MSKALLEAMKRFCVIVCFLLQPGDQWAVGCVAVTPGSPCWQLYDSDPLCPLCLFCFAPLPLPLVGFKCQLGPPSVDSFNCISVYDTPSVAGAHGMSVWPAVYYGGVHWGTESDPLGCKQ